MLSARVDAIERKWSRAAIRCPSDAQRRPLRELFVSGKRSLQIELPKIPNLPQTVDRLLAQIPAGRLTTYGDLAEGLGSRHAARWVAQYLKQHAHEARCACHRVIRNTGEPGSYGDGGLGAQIQRLAGEGLIAERGILPLADARFGKFNSPRPLQQLLAWQSRVSKAVRIEAPEAMPDLVGAVDICYAEPNRAIAAFVLSKVHQEEPVWSTTVEMLVQFPYISTFLTFRELPVLLKLIEKVRASGRLPDVVLVDGSGLLHPRRVGLACSLGVVADVATVAVAKKLLCGRPERTNLQRYESCDVLYESEVLGTAMRGESDCFNPVYVSPGHRTDVPFAASLVKNLLARHRLPEPLFHADRLGKLSR